MTCKLPTSENDTVLLREAVFFNRHVSVSTLGRRDQESEEEEIEERKTYESYFDLKLYVVFLSK